MLGDTFITYTHPDQQYDKKNKKKVASYIGTHYRNRSRPAARQAQNTVNAEEDIEASSAPEPVVADSEPRQLVLNSRKPAANLHRDSHGLRTDPFTSYPIKPAKCVPGAIDYFLNFFAPTHVIRPELIKAEDSTKLVKQYFQLALSHPLLFETIVALSQISLTSNQWADQDENSSSPATVKPDKDALSHYGKALARLRNILDDETALMDDAVLFAIATLMGVDYLTNNLASFEAHLGGLRRIISIRGGIDELGWPTLLKPLLNGLEGIWAYMSLTPPLLQTDSAITDIPAHARVYTPPLPTPTVPMPPLPSLPIETPAIGWTLPSTGPAPDTTGWTSSTAPAYFTPCLASPTGVSNLSYLPVGFQILSLTTPPLFSLPVSTLLHRISTTGGLLNHRVPSALRSRNGIPLEKRFNNASNLQELEYCVRVLGWEGLSTLERITCQAILTILLDSTRSERISGVWIRQCQHYCQDILDILNSNEWEEMREDERNCIAWAAMDLAGTMVPPRSWKQHWPKWGGRGDKRLALATRIVKEYGSLGRGRTWEEIEEVLATYFWTDGCKASWKNVWMLAERWLEEEGGELR